MKINIDSRQPLKPSVRRAVEKTIKAAMKQQKKNGSVSVLITDDEEMLGLNRQFRSIDSTTDVLSFPAEEEALFGDIAISLDRAKAQAEEYGHSLEREMAFLAAHAMLHLFGFDHEVQEEEQKMRQLQRQILDRSGYSVK